MIRASTFLRRADRRKQLMESQLPRDVSLPAAQWRPTVLGAKRVRLDGYGHAFELEAESLLGKWRVFHDEPDTQGTREVTSAPLEFDDAFSVVCERCEGVRAIANATPTDAAEQSA